MLSSDMEILSIYYNDGFLWQLNIQRNKLPSITNINTPGVFVLLLNDQGVREPGTQFANIPEYFFDTTNSTFHEDGLDYYTNGPSIIRFDLEMHIYIQSFGFNIFKLTSTELYGFPQKSWLLQYKSVDPISELGVDIGNTIKRGFPEYPGANNIIIDTQQLWVKDMGVATYQLVVAGNDTNELYFIFLYGNINFSINAIIGYSLSLSLNDVVPLLSTISQNSLNLYSNIDQPGVYVFKYNGSDMIMPRSDQEVEITSSSTTTTDHSEPSSTTTTEQSSTTTTEPSSTTTTEPSSTTTTEPSSTTTTEPSSTTFSVSPTINGTSDASLDGGQIAGITVAAIIVIIGIIIILAIVVVIM